MPFGLDVVYDYIKAVIARLWPEPPTEAVSSSSPSPSLRSTSSYDSYPSLPSPSGALRSEYWVPVDPPLSPPLWQWHAPRLITLPGAEADSGEESEEDVPIRHILQRRTGNTSTRVTFVAPVTTSPGSSFQPTPRATDVVSSSKALVDYPSSSEDELARTDAGFMGDVMETGRGSGVARTVRVADGSQENVRSQSSNKERAITASEEANQSGSETSGFVDNIKPTREVC
ncbi:hypothetical protein FRC04_000617 [Tulasnella sp. 424]|nr:hypothetical protein FRC04_000617 [Tulasnella sp. 424]KAG8969151.1 hypothetical protein FRC05_001195 [Tulasnella sp. 425]